jgi:hypothetical protein
VIVFCEHITPRLSYAVQELARRMGISNARITTQTEDIQHFHGLRINYSTIDIPQCFQVVPDGLLSEKTLRHEDPEYIHHEEIPLFFPTGGDLSFDVFASLFWMLSRYEEYANPVRDPHGRFPFEFSLLYRLGVLDKAVAEHQVAYFLQVLKQHGWQLETQAVPAEMLMTIDVDHAWAYRHKSAGLQFLVSTRDLLRGNFQLFKRRRRVLNGLEKDPFDTYDFIRASAAGKAKVIFFFLLGDRTKQDRNTHYAHPALQALIRDLNQWSELGIHPSYFSHDDSGKQKTEIQRLSGITGNPVHLARFHFLRFRLPDSFRELQQNGVHRDFSIGYAGHYGFRAGTCLPFLFYDLPHETTLGLECIPLAAMDGTLNEYMKLSPEEAKIVSTRLHREAQQFGAFPVFLWHNETLSDEGKWKGWRDVFLHQLNLSKAY